jgi:hypothetical protein
MNKATAAGPDSNRRMRVVAGVLAIAFGSLISGIILIANRGELDEYFGVLNRIPNGDKVGHFCLMGILSLFVNLSFLARRVSIAGWKVLLGSMIVTLLVTAEELSQAFFPHRTMDLFDWLADMAGIILFGKIAIWIVARKSS